MNPKFLITLIITISSSLAHVTSSSNETTGHISFGVSETGLEFTKNLMIKTAISNLIPLTLPDIEQTVQIPLVGKVKMVVSNIVIYNVEVVKSVVQSGDLGLTIVASGATADLRFDWSYTYTTWFFDISDNGIASVKLDEMLEKRGVKVDKVLNFAIDDAVLEERITGRWIHPSSGRSYYSKFAPPNVPGIYDESRGSPAKKPPPDYFL